MLSYGHKMTHKMEKYLIEVPHEATKAACVNAVRVFLQTGSHFLANADWGCHDGEHKAWLLVERIPLSIGRKSRKCGGDVRWISMVAPRA